MKRAPKVLLLDDDANMMALLSLVLEERGYKVDSASDGRRALETIKSERDKYDVVICDYNMPEMDGKEFLAGLKRAGFVGKTLIYSGYITRNVEVWRKSLGADAVIPKVGTDALLATLEKWTNWN